MNTADESWIKKNKEAELDYKLGSGQITIAEYVGLGKRELYEIAKQGYKLLERGKIEEARDIYQGLVSADPYDSVFHCHLGSIYVRLNQQDKALEQFELSLQYNIANIDAFVGRGEIYLSKGEIQKAIEDFKKAIELDKENKRGSTVRAKAILFALKDAIEKQQSSQNA
jgi:tetratricopeptide (TPR) repeat protein